MNIYVTIVEVPMKKKKKDEIQFTIKIGEKTSLFHFVKFSFSITHLMPY
jgi:hypothetical protein